MKVPDTPKSPHRSTASRWSSGRVMLVIALGVAVIAGCTAEQSKIDRVMEVIGVDHLMLPAETRDELVRFEEVYNRYADEEAGEERLSYFRFAFRRVRTAYVNEVSDRELVDKAIAGLEQEYDGTRRDTPDKVVETALDAMLASLDPHSDYMTAEEFRESFVQTKGEFGGLGIEVTMEEGFVKVVAPIEDTPAMRAGIKSGDLITAVDGESLEGKSLTEAVRTMRGRPGSEILLRVRRDGVDDFDVVIVRAVIKVRSVRWRIQDGVGYVRVTRFTEKVEGGIAKALAELKNTPGQDISGLILDLRSNPGGLLEQSLILADGFLDDGEIVSVRGRTPENRRSYDASPGDLARGLPMVVLIDGGSASASEIVASALQFHGRAVVMGQQSFGKGSVQTIMPLPMDGALRLTTARYYAPDGQTIQARGVEPDIILKTEEQIERRREADLPGALPEIKTDLAHRTDTVPESACREVGEAKDRMLGCAIEFLRAGSKANFLAGVRARGDAS